MDTFDFAWRHAGDVVKAPEGLGGECVDLTNLYIMELFGLPHIFANAVDWRNVTIRGFKWVANTPSNFPPPGAIVVWGPEQHWGIGANGHIAVALGAGPLHMATLDQNWPDHAPVTLHLHDYRGVLGWHQRG